jgi:hypothetical protein
MLTLQREESQPAVGHDPLSPRAWLVYECFLGLFPEVHDRSFDALCELVKASASEHGWEGDDWNWYYWLSSALGELADQGLVEMRYDGAQEEYCYSLSSKAEETVCQERGLARPGGEAQTAE